MLEYTQIYRVGMLTASSNSEEGIRLKTYAGKQHYVLDGSLDDDVMVYS